LGLLSLAYLDRDLLEMLDVVRQLVYEEDIESTSMNAQCSVLMKWIVTLVGCGDHVKAAV
jgi:hypothetical protein